MKTRRFPTVIARDYSPLKVQTSTRNKWKVHCAVKGVPMGDEAERVLLREVAKAAKKLETASRP